MSIETNPNAIDKDTLTALQQAGVNRLSIGVQSFSERMLQNIGRQHSARQAVMAFEQARESGINNISVDLMYGLPGQDSAEWERSLVQAVALSPEHLSIYELTIEPGTLFAALADQGKLNLPLEEDILEMVEQTRETLTEKGYRQYEL